MLCFFFDIYFHTSFLNYQVNRLHEHSGIALCYLLFVIDNSKVYSAVDDG